MGDLVPLQSGTDQLDADLVENAIFGLFDRFRRDIFVAHFSCMDRQLFGNSGCHCRFSRVFHFALKGSCVAWRLFPFPSNPVGLGELSSAAACQASEHGAFHQARPTRIIIEKRAAGDFSCGKKAADDIPAGILDFAFSVMPTPPKVNVMPQVTGNA